MPVVRALALANMERGTHSTGLMDARGAYCKDASKASEYLQKKYINTWIQERANGLAMCGHTRMASRGAHTTDNAHPFRYGLVTGMHNGVIDAPNTYAVDSEYAFDLLASAEPGAYQEALKDVVGWYVLVWHDVRDGMLYFLNWNGSLFFTKTDLCFYYSSDARHLRATLGNVDTFEVTQGQVYRFCGRRLKKLRDFTGKHRPAVKRAKCGDWDYSTQQHRGYLGGGVYGSEYKSHYEERHYTGDVKLESDGKWYAEVRPSGKMVSGFEYELIPDQADMQHRFPNSTPPHWRKLASWMVEKMFPIEDTVLEPSEVALSPSQLEAEMRKAELERDQLAGEDLMASARQRRRKELEAEGLFDAAIEHQLEQEGFYEKVVIAD